MKEIIFKVTFDKEANKIDIQYQDLAAFVNLTSAEIGYRFYVEKQQELFKAFIGIVADVASMSMNEKIDEYVIDGFRMLIPHYRKINIRLAKDENEKMN